MAKFFSLLSSSAALWTLLVHQTGAYMCGRCSEGGSSFHPATSCYKSYADCLEEFCCSDDPYSGLFDCDANDVGLCLDEPPECDPYSDVYDCLYGGDDDSTCIDAYFSDLDARFYRCLSIKCCASTGDTSCPDHVPECYDYLNTALVEEPTCNDVDATVQKCVEDEVTGFDSSTCYDQLNQYEPIDREYIDLSDYLSRLSEEDQDAYHSFQFECESSRCCDDSDSACREGVNLCLFGPGAEGGPPSCKPEVEECVLGPTTDECPEDGGFFELTSNNGHQCLCPGFEGSEENFHDFCAPYGSYCTDPDCGSCWCDLRPCPAWCEHAFEYTNTESGKKTLLVCYQTLNVEDLSSVVDLSEEGGLDNVEYCALTVFSPHGFNRYLHLDGLYDGDNCNMCSTHARRSFELGSTTPEGEILTAYHKICPNKEDGVIPGSGSGFCAAPCFCTFPSGLTITSYTEDGVDTLMTGGAMDDPHFKTWNGTWYDWMGACDLHLLSAPDFLDGLGLTIDIRTTIRFSYSYIESAVLRLGEDTLEVASYGQYYANGISNADMPFDIAGYTVTHTNPSEHVHLFEIDLGRNETIMLKTFKDMVSVKLMESSKNKGLQTSVGMMGEFGSGKLLARDGVTVVEDPAVLAREWQVRDDEPVLFASARAPQYPQECILPEPMDATKARRLGETTISLEAAEMACASWADNKEGCIHDVMATGDIELAGSGAFL